MPIRATVQAVRERGGKLGPGTQKFLKSLSIVTVCFALSKVFSSLATIIVARYLGPVNFGEATIVLLVGQVLSLFMLAGLHVSLMKYGAAEENPGPQAATSAYLGGFTTLLVAAGTWLLREPLTQLLGTTEYKLGWGIAIGAMFSGYAMMTSLYQALNLFKERGIVEVIFAFLLLPGLAVGHLLTGGEYQTVLIAYAIAYVVSLPFMVWKFRHLLSPRNLFATNTREMLHYGAFACLSNFGFIASFLVQPLQLEQVHGEGEVGVFRIYSQGSINLAAFATSIFYTVFFPKVSVSNDRAGIWRRLTKAWLRAALPLLVMFVGLQTVIVALSGKEYPLRMEQVVLLAVASVLITVQATYGQIIASQGVRGIRWGLWLSIMSGVVNFVLTWWLVGPLGITGAAMALMGNYGITLAATIWVGRRVIGTASPA